MALYTVTDDEALTFGLGTRADLLNSCRVATGLATASEHG